MEPNSPGWVLWSPRRVPISCRETTVRSAPFPAGPNQNRGVGNSRAPSTVYAVYANGMAPRLSLNLGRLGLTCIIRTHPKMSGFCGDILSPAMDSPLDRFPLSSVLRSGGVSLYHSSTDIVLIFGPQTPLPSDLRIYIRSTPTIWVTTNEAMMRGPGVCLFHRLYGVAWRLFLSFFWCSCSFSSRHLSFSLLFHPPACPGLCLVS
ncbi:uncharacterized protein BO80DRAFT_219087 [Aspergillus ibericus CBS 121593]|uniref:Uncharacterized protein n=1 Tax=Aspergillus ibericus CBS 121593 TaxID=1448316 RepID=A0A395GMJ1_9EURO|nr:hypothetical protein BO80DRAFT_219087 [Aspergillus ibericus CBS 121593]RAK96730.1 hypothetical protein BO80DRAFT_219087 [Aspergillus ibericus CBS 121593]